jgi:phage baseplate assembly protein W
MMSRTTGQRLDAVAHLRQSIGDILSTPIGSRVMRREYGSLVPALIDKPDNLATQTRFFAAAASALMRWEPRVKVDRMAITRDTERQGRISLEITGSYVGTFGRESAPLTLSVPLGSTTGGAA